MPDSTPFIIPSDSHAGAPVDAQSAAAAGVHDKWMAELGATQNRSRSTDTPPSANSDTTTANQAQGADAIASGGRNAPIGQSPDGRSEAPVSDELKWTQNPAVRKLLQERQASEGLNLRGISDQAKTKPDFAPILEREILRGATGKQLRSYDRLESLQRLGKYVDPESQLMKRISELDTPDLFRLDRFIRADPIKGVALLEREAAKNDLRLITGDRLRGLEALELSLGANSDSMRRILEMESKDGLDLARLAEFIEANPQKLKTFIIDRIAAGETAKEIGQYARYEPFGNLAEALADKPEAISRIRRLATTDGLNVADLANFIKTQTASRTELIASEVTRGANAAQLNSYYRLRGLEQLELQLGSDPATVTKLLEAEKQGLSLWELGRYVGDLPTDRTQTVKRELLEGASVQQLHDQVTLAAFPSEIAATLAKQASGGAFRTGELISNLRDLQTGPYLQQLVKAHVDHGAVLTDADVTQLTKQARELFEAKAPLQNVRQDSQPQSTLVLPLTNKTVAEIAPVIRKAAEDIMASVPPDRTIVLLGRDMGPLLPILRANGRDARYFLWSRKQIDDPSTAQQWLKEVPPNAVVIDVGLGGSVIDDIKKVDGSAKCYLVGSGRKYPDSPVGDMKDAADALEVFPKLTGRSLGFNDQGIAIAPDNSVDPQDFHDQAHRQEVVQFNGQLMRDAGLSDWYVWRYETFTGLAPDERIGVGSSDAVAAEMNNVAHLRQPKSDVEDRRPAEDARHEQAADKHTDDAATELPGTAGLAAHQDSDESRSITGAQQPGRADAPSAQDMDADAPAAKKKAKDPVLEALKKSEDVDGLVHYAQTIQDKKLAGQAVQAIEKAQPANLGQILHDLAAGSTYATAAAMDAYMLQDESMSKGIDLYYQRFQNGDIERLWKEGKLDIAEVLEVVSNHSSSETPTNDFDRKISDLAKSVAGDPQLSGELAKALLMPNGFAGAESGWSIKNVSNAVRMEAMSVLSKAGSPGVESLLLNTAASKDPEIMAQAKAELLKIWAAKESQASGESSRSALLTGDAVAQFTERTAALNWSEPSDLPDKYRLEPKLVGQRNDLRFDFTLAFDQYVMNRADTPKPDSWEEWENPHNDLLDNPEQMRKFLKDEPALLKQFDQFQTKQAELDKTEQFIERNLKARTADLQTAVDALTDSLHLPRTTINVVKTLKNAAGVYMPGTGQIAIPEKQLLRSGSVSPDLLGTVLHEVNHHEQDNLKLRSLMDEKQIEGSVDAGQRQALKQLYKERTGSKLSDQFLDKVLAARGSKRLTPGETTRAQDLCAASLDRNTAQEPTELMEKLSRSSKALSTEKMPLFITISGVEANEFDKVARRLGIKELSQTSRDAWNKYKAASGSDEAQAEKEAKAALLSDVLKEQMPLEQKSYRAYRGRLNENESHEVGNRTTFLAAEANARHASLELLKPGDSVYYHDMPGWQYQGRDRAGKIIISHGDPPVSIDAEPAEVRSQFFGAELQERRTKDAAAEFQRTEPLAQRPQIDRFLAEADQSVSLEWTKSRSGHGLNDHEIAQARAERLTKFISQYFRIKATDVDGHDTLANVKIEVAQPGEEPGLIYHDRSGRAFKPVDSKNGELIDSEGNALKVSDATITFRAPEGLFADPKLLLQEVYCKGLLGVRQDISITGRGEARGLDHDQTEHADGLVETATRTEFEGTQRRVDHTNLTKGATAESGRIGDAYYVNRLSALTELRRSEITVDGGIARFRGASIDLIAAATKGIDDLNKQLEDLRKQAGKEKDAAEKIKLTERADALAQRIKDYESARDAASNNGDFQGLTKVFKSEFPEQLAREELRLRDTPDAPKGGGVSGCVYLFAALLPLFCSAGASASERKPTYSAPIPVFGR